MEKELKCRNVWSTIAEHHQEKLTKAQILTKREETGIEIEIEIEIDALCK
jgi:hypothetical protein